MLTSLVFLITVLFCYVLTIYHTYISKKYSSPCDILRLLVSNFLCNNMKYSAHIGTKQKIIYL